MNEERIVSGIKPSGELHLGNYFGATKDWVELQNRYACFYFIADYHALTDEWYPVELRSHTLKMVLDLLACGIDPDRSILFLQSDVPEHAELTWIFNCLTGFGDLERMTQFKERKERLEQTESFLNVGLFDYPVLQAADVLIYHATQVPVGEDQLQHLELCRRIARRFNSRFGSYFVEPRPVLGEAPRIMSLTDPQKKMSKSQGDRHTIRLMESDESMWEKIRAAVTDVGPRAEKMSPGVRNLFLLLRLVAPALVSEELMTSYGNGTLRYEMLKKTLFEHILKALRPIRERRDKLTEEDAKKVLERGAKQARAIAQETLREVRTRVGLGS
jgi:tryptophanyl-tRNA synthetase